jgi:hypothetical protein
MEEFGPALASMEALAERVAGEAKLWVRVVRCPTRQGPGTSVQPT